MLDGASLAPILAVLGTRVNRLWAVLRAFPLHGVEYLLGLGQEIIEPDSWTADADGYRLTLYVLQDDRPVLESFPDAPIGPIGVPEEVYILVGGILADDVVDLQALDSSYGD